MGAVPTQLETGDIPTAFATGRVDAMITSPSTGVSSQAWDFTNNYTDTQAWLPKNMVIVNTAAFDGAARGSAQRAAGGRRRPPRPAAGRCRRAETAEKIAALKENGMTVSQPSEELSQRSWPRSARP